MATKTKPAKKQDTFSLDESLKKIKSYREDIDFYLEKIKIAEENITKETKKVKEYLSPVIEDITVCLF